MYAVSPYPLKVYLQRYNEAEKNLYCDSKEMKKLSEDICEYYWSFYAAGSHSLEEYKKRIDSAPIKNAELFYAYSRHNPEKFKQRYEEAKKYNLDHYLIKKDSQFKGLLDFFYAGSDHSITKFIQRLKTGRSHFTEEFSLFSYAMSKNDIKTFKARFKEISNSIK